MRVFAIQFLERALVIVVSLCNNTFSSVGCGCVADNDTRISNTLLSHGLLQEVLERDGWNAVLTDDQWLTNVGGTLPEEDTAEESKQPSCLPTATPRATSLHLLGRQDLHVLKEVQNKVQAKNRKRKREDDADSGGANKRQALSVN